MAQQTNDVKNKNVLELLWWEPERSKILSDLEVGVTEELLTNVGVWVIRLGEIDVLGTMAKNGILVAGL
jgi:hypothetical protein